MTRNEYTAQAAMLLFVHKTDKDGNDISTDVALLGAEILADKLEEKGCAPWQDAPPIERITGSNSPLTFAMQERDKPAVNCGTCRYCRSGVCAVDSRKVTASDVCDAHMPHYADTPTRREITAADVQPGAIFVDRDGDDFRVVSVAGGNVICKYNGLYFDKSTLIDFVAARNRQSSTVTPPTA